MLVVDRTDQHPARNVSSLRPVLPFGRGTSLLQPAACTSMPHKEGTASSQDAPRKLKSGRRRPTER
jgi:hypothetical protein